MNSRKTFFILIQIYLVILQVSAQTIEKETPVLKDTTVIRLREDGSLASMDSYFKSGRVVKCVVSRSGTLANVDGTWGNLDSVYNDWPPKGNLMTWYDNGVLARIDQYNDKGLSHGYSIEWYENGQRKHEAYYENDLWHGMVSTWYENGNMALRLNFVNGQNDGDCVEWYESGSIKEEGSYKKGMKNGVWRKYDIQGLLVETQYFENDSLIKVE